MLNPCPCSGIQDQGVLYLLQFELATVSSSHEKALQVHKLDPEVKMKPLESLCQTLNGSLMLNNKVLTRGMNPESFKAIWVNVRIQLIVRIPLYIGMRLAEETFQKCKYSCK